MKDCNHERRKSFVLNLKHAVMKISENMQRITEALEM